MRVTEVFRNNEWIEIDFSELEINENVRYFDDNGKKVFDAKGRCVWITASIPYLTEDGILAISVY